MKFAFKSLVAAVAFVAAGAASAASLTLAEGASVTDQGWTVSGLTGSSTLAFSDTLLGALALGEVNVAGVLPAAVTIDGYTSITAQAPVRSLSGSFDGSTLAIESVATEGGAIQTLTPNDVGNGGYISITNLRVDLINNDVYATIDGGNGVGVINDLKLWHISSIEGATSFTAQEGTITSVNKLSGLKIYDDAFALFVKATGLNDDLGAPSLGGVNDDPNGYGTIYSTITVTANKVATPQVPEPSTYALMGLGLVGISLVSRRRAAK